MWENERSPADDVGFGGRGENESHKRGLWVLPLHHRSNQLVRKHRRHLGWIWSHLEGDLEIIPHTFRTPKNSKNSQNTKIFQEIKDLKKKRRIPRIEGGGGMETGSEGSGTATSI